LLYALQSINKVISSKNTLPILDNFLLKLYDNTLTVTASDLETTLSVNLPINTVDREGETTLQAKLLTETLKEFPEQPLTFVIDPETLSAEISWATGKFNVPCSSADEYPQMPEISEEHNSLTIEAELLQEGIAKTIFATADDELRPSMNGVYFDIKTDGMTFVATDAHKLVRYKLPSISVENDCSFILPKKPANFLKGLLAKEEGVIKLNFDDRHATFTTSRFNMSCRLIEGVFPAYNSVIPVDNPRKLMVDRVEFLTAIRRVSVFSNQATNLIKLRISGNEINISAQDLDFSISANERVNCRYDGDDIEIGFKSTFLVEIFSNLSAADISAELSDAGRAGIFLPVATDDERNDDLLMLLMPIIIGV
jgi:DNA polymerase-3 subunit beta